MQYCNALNWNFNQQKIPYNSFPRRPIFLPSPKRINSATLHFARKILIFSPLNRQRHSTPNNPRLNPENLDLKRTNVVLKILRVKILSDLPNSKNINQTNTKTLNADLIHIFNQEEKSSKFNIKINYPDGKTKMARVITNSNHPIQQEINQFSLEKKIIVRKN